MSVDHEAKLVEKITSLLTRDSFNDIEIRLNNGVQVVANKVILAAMSSFFEKHLNDELLCSSSEKLLEVDIDVSSTKEVFDLVIRYFYTGKMNFESLPLKDLLDLLNLLVFLDLKELFTLVEEFTRNKIREGSFSLEKVLILSSTAETYCFYSIISSMLFFLNLNLCDVSKLPEVRYLSHDFIGDLIKHDMEGNCSREKYFSKFEVMTAWLADQENEVEEEVKNKLISMFDLEKFSNLQLTTAVRQSKLFKESSILDVLGKSIMHLERENKTLKVIDKTAADLYDLSESDIWLKADQLHLTYLQEEAGDSTVKHLCRKELERVVRHYLSTVPQGRRFSLPTAGDIIKISANQKPDFSFIKAANAFRAIEEHAKNLINHPFKQKLLRIRLNSGFFKRSVDSALIGAKKMFLDMGYRADPTMPHTISFTQPKDGQNPVDIDLVTLVARDCLLASVECNMLAEIRFLVGAQLPITLKEVIQFRREFMGSVDECAQELFYRKNQN